VAAKGAAVVITLTQILGCEVVTESGQSLNRVWDVRAEHRSDGLYLVGLLVGRFAFAERLGLRHWRGQPPAARLVSPARELVPWESVLRIDGQRIVVRDGTKPVRA